MSRSVKDLSGRLPKNTKHFLQPLALVFICAVFIILVLVSSLMDLRRSDRTMIGFMQNRGSDIIGNLQRIAQGNYSNLTQLLGGAHANDTIVPFSEETFLPQESLIKELVNLVQYVDRAWQHGHYGLEQAVKLAGDESLRLVALFDKQGKATLKTGQIPREILERAAPVIFGPKDIAIELFNNPGRAERTGFIAIHRSAAEGSVLIVLDQRGFQYWGEKIAVQRAVDETGWGKDVLYLSVMNRRGQVLGNAGFIDDVWEKDALLDLINRPDTTVSYRKLRHLGKDVLEIIGPIHIDNRVVGTVRVGLDRERADRLLSEYYTSMLISMAAIMVIGVLSIWLLFYNQNRHLKKIGEMGKRLQRSERLSSLGQLAAGVAHEIRNPLNAISMASQRMQREYLPLLEEGRREEFKQLTGVVRDEIRRLNAIIGEFLNFSKTDRLELRECAVEDILQKLVSLIEEEALTRGVQIQKDWSAKRSVIAMDVDKLQQAFLNFIKNGMESISGEGLLTIGVSKIEGKAVLVTITDTGSGLKPEELDRIFNPEYTTKEQGLGLGLSISHEIIRAHGGDIHVKSEVGKGSSFEIRLPLKIA